MSVTLRTSVKEDGREFSNYLTFDVMRDGVVIGQIQSVEVAAGFMRVSTIQVERGSWIAWAGAPVPYAVEEKRPMRRHTSKEIAITWIEQEAGEA